MRVDMVQGVGFGDEGKSKVTFSLLMSGRYSHTMRFNGSHNAGHTFYIDGQKVITHLIPTGAAIGIPSFIGSGCVVHERDFIKELDYLKQFNPRVHDCVKVAHNAHIVTDAHRSEEVSESKIGTTRLGVGPCYRDKYARTGLRAESSDTLAPYLVNFHDWLDENAGATILAEGAQSLGLDIDSDSYPYVTSSHCGVGGLINNGISHRSIYNIYAVAKAYDTYVGNKIFQNKEDPLLDRIGDAGAEFGATTGRRRQVNYLNIDFLAKQLRRGSATHLIINKMDILQQLGLWRVIKGGAVLDLGSEADFKELIKNSVGDINITFSYTPYGV